MMKKLQDGTWVHINCVNWTPEIWFTDDYKNKIAGKVASFRQEINCQRCHKAEGSCIQCDFKNCGRSYHVRCAIKRDLIGSWEEMHKRLGEPADHLATPVFCHKHLVEGTKIFKQLGEAGIAPK